MGPFYNTANEAAAAGAAIGCDQVHMHKLPGGRTVYMPCRSMGQLVLSYVTPLSIVGTLAAGLALATWHASASIDARLRRVRREAKRNGHRSRRTA